MTRKSPLALKSKNYTATYLLVLIFVVLLGFTFWSQRSDEKEQSLDSAYRFYDENIASSAKRIELTGRSQRHVLSKSNNRFVVESQGNYAADETQINALLSTIGSMLGDTLVSVNPAKQETLGVTENLGVMVRVFGDNDALLAAFIVGNVGPTFDQSYIRKIDSDEVYLVGDNIRSTFDKADWRDRTIVPFSVENFDSFAIRRIIERVSQSYKVSKNGDSGNWEVEGNEFALDQAKVSELLSLLSGLKGLAFQEQTPLSLPELESIENSVKIWVHTSPNDQAFTLYFYKKEEDFSAYRTDMQYAFTIGQSIFDAFNVGASELKQVEEVGI